MHEVIAEMELAMFFGMSESEASKMVERVGKIFNFIIDLITLLFRLAYDAIVSIMDMLGIDAGDVVNGIVVVFSTLFDVLTSLFRFAWDVISDLFDIWENDTIYLVDKIINSFASVGEKIIAPFKFAVDWIKDKFLGVIDRVTIKVKNALSFISISFDDDSLINLMKLT